MIGVGAEQGLGAAACRRSDIMSSSPASLRLIALEDMEAKGYGDLLPVFNIEGKTEDF